MSISSTYVNNVGRMLLISVMAVLTVVMAPAQEWQAVSTRTLGVTSKIAVGPTEIVLYDNDTLLVSRDNGSTWQEPQTGLPGRVNDVVWTGSAWLATGETPSGSEVTTGFYVSTDGCRTFSLSGTCNVPGGVIQQLVVDGNTMYGCSNRQLFVKSIDGGATWVTGSLADGIGNAIEIAVAGDTYVAVGTGGTFRSTDAGTTWTPLSPLPGTGGGVTSVRMLDGRIVAAGTLGAYEFAENRWTQLRGLPVVATLPAVVQSMYVFQGSLYVVCVPFGGTVQVYRLTGTTWSKIGSREWSGQHGASRRMIAVRADAVFLHYHGLGQGEKGLYRIENTTSFVDENTEELSVVSPNPSLDFVNIQVAEQIPVVVRTVVGEVVYEGVGSTTLSGLMSGTYTLHVGTRTTVFVVSR